MMLQIEWRIYHVSLVLVIVHWYFILLHQCVTLPEFGSLPSANILSSVFFRTRQISSLSSATQKTLATIKHSAKKFFAECFIFGTWQIASLPSAFFNIRQRQFKNHILKQ
jgi:hypothetical protein